MKTMHCRYDPYNPCEQCGKCRRGYDEEDERDPDREYELKRDTGDET